MATWKPLTLKRDGVCATCSTALPEGSRALWNGKLKKLSCLEHVALDEIEVETASSTAGASARAEHERRKNRYEKKVRQAHPILGGLILAVNAEPQRVQAWEKGARGEEAIGTFLDQQAAAGGYRTLHDRRIPGTKANIDHIVIAPSGVYVIDAKNYRGMVTIERQGGWLSKESATLRVGSRNCTSLVAGVQWQVGVVRNALAAQFSEIPVRGMLAFYAAEWPWLGKPQEIDGVLINGKGIGPIINRAGALECAQLETLAKALSAALPLK